MKEREPVSSVAESSLVSPDRCLEADDVGLKRREPAPHTVDAASRESDPKPNAPQSRMLLGTGDDADAGLKPRSETRRLSAFAKRMLFAGDSPNTPFEQKIRGDVFEMVEVNEVSSGMVVSVCRGETCCRLSYVRTGSTSSPHLSPLHSGEYFAFGAFEGVHDSIKDWFFQACVLVRCTNSSHSSCGQVTWHSSTFFSFMQMSGE